MKRRHLAAMACVISMQALIATANAGGSSSSVSLFSGSIYLDLERTNRELYAAGIVDGLVMSVELDLDADRIQHLSECIDHIGKLRVSKILDYYLDEHPDKEKELASRTLFTALSETCRTPPAMSEPNK